MSVSKSGSAAGRNYKDGEPPGKRRSASDGEIIEGLNDNGSPQSEAIRSVSPANEAQAALPR